MGVEVFDSVFSNSTSSTSSPYYLCSFVFYGRYDFFPTKKWLKNQKKSRHSVMIKVVFGGYSGVCWSKIGLLFGSYIVRYASCRRPKK